MNTGDVFPTFGRVARAAGPIAARTSMGVARGAVWCAKRGWKPLLALVLVLAVAHSIATLVLGRRLEAEIDKIRAAGEPVSPAQLAGHKIPDSQNGAVIYLRAFKEMNAISKGVNARLGANYELLPNSFSVVAGLAPVAPQLWGEARQAVAAFAPVFELARQAAAKPECRFPTRWELGLRAGFPNLADVRHLARLLAVKALVAARDGKRDEALDACSQLLRLSDSLRDDPTVIHALTRLSVLDYSACALQGVARNVDIDDSAARSISRQLDEMELRTGFVEAVKGERAILIGLFNDIRAKRVDPEELLESDAGNLLVVWRVRICGSYLGRPWLYADELVMLKRMREQIDQFRRPFLESLQTEDTPGEPNDGPITWMICPRFLRARTWIERGQAEIYGGRILLGLKAYESRFGAYPTTLADLRSRLSWRTPQDPFTGKDFIYRASGKGLILYSVGVNMKDDGGVATGEREDPSKHGDIVWRLDR